VFIPGDIPELVAGGALVSVLCLPANNEAAEEGNDQLQLIIENFQKNLSDNRLEWLKKTIAEFEKKTHHNERLLLLLIVPHEDKRALYVAGVGPMQVVIERKGKKQLVWNEKKSGQVVSGWLMNDDLVSAGTTEFVNEVWQETTGDLGSRIESAQAAIGGHGQQALMAGVVLELTEAKLDKPIKEDVESLPPVRWVESETRTESETESYPLPTLRRPSFNLNQRIMGGKALSWLSGENARPSRKASLVVGAVFLLLLISSVGVGAVRKQKLEQEADFVSVLDPLTHSLDEAANLKAVNPVRARSLVAEAKDKATQIGDKYSKTPFNDRWQQFLNRLNSSWADVSGENQTAGKLWLDLKIIRDYLTGQDLVLVDNKLGIVDRSNGAVALINLSDKNAKIIAAGEGLKQTQAVDTWHKQILVMGPTGINTYADPAPKDVTFLAKDEEVWSQVSLLSGFAGNLYLAGGVDIWRYPGLDGGVAKRQRWLKPGLEPDLSKMVDWALDGEIWILQKDGRVLRFNQGQAVSYEIKGLVKPLSDPERLVINSSTKELVILDKGLKSLVFVSQETGDYKHQIIWDKLGDANDIVVDQANNRVMVLIGHEIYELSL
jgi:hypothetical protein